VPFSFPDIRPHVTGPRDQRTGVRNQTEVAHFGAYRGSSHSTPCTETPLVIPAESRARAGLHPSVRTGPWTPDRPGLRSRSGCFGGAGRGSRRLSGVTVWGRIRARSFFAGTSPYKGRPKRPLLVSNIRAHGREPTKGIFTTETPRTQRSTAEGSCRAPWARASLLCALRGLRGEPFFVFRRNEPMQRGASANPAERAHGRGPGEHSLFVVPDSAGSADPGPVRPCAGRYGPRIAALGGVRGDGWGRGLRFIRRNEPMKPASRRRVGGIRGNGPMQRKRSFTFNRLKGIFEQGDIT